MSNRKELKAQYLERKKTKGVIVVQCKTTGARFIDATSDADSAFNRIRWELQFSPLAGSLPAELKRDWKEHGEASFAFELAEVLKEPEEEGTGFDEKRELAAMLKRHRG